LFQVRPEVEAGVEKYLERLGSGESQEESDDDEEEDEPKQKWDCESILSTYSNLYNHPKLIAEPPKPAKIAGGYFADDNCCASAKFCFLEI
jgi:hypothetical protein